MKSDFPALHQTVNGRPLVYLDNGATTQKPQAVIDAVQQYYQEQNSNVHRGVHFLSQQATDLYEEARRKVQKFLNAKYEEEIIWTMGTTHALNLIAQSLGSTFKSGQEIILTEMEHHANIVPWQMLAQQKGLKIKVIPVLEDGSLDLETFYYLLNEKTAVVSLTHTSNVLGTVNPVKRIIHAAHQQGVPVVLDGAQAVPHDAVDVQDLDADFFVFSAHKLFAPTGMGVMYGKKDWLERIPPYFGGGNMIKKVSFEETTYGVLPHKFEAGTPHISGAIGLGVAIDYLASIGGMQVLQKLEAERYQSLLAQVSDIPNLKIYGTNAHKAAILSFNVGNLHPFDVGTLLDKQGIAVRTGHHCCMPLHEKWGVSGSVRASLAFYNDADDIQRFADALHRAVDMLS